MKTQRIITLILLLLVGAGTFAQNVPYTLLVSFDGFRWDYTSRGLTPNIDKLSKEGVTALSFEPSFPSKTFPNHYSIVTGMYPQNHGIISNFFTDPITKQKYSLGDSNAVRNAYWYWGETFWETAERQGIKCASYFWPGSEVNIPYRRASYYENYEHNRPYITRVDGVLNWLTLPFSERPKFITLYFDAADTYAHRYGPDSKEVNNVIQSLDSLVGYLVNGLKSMNMIDSVNIILLSDHGMTELDESKIVRIDSLLKGFKYKLDGNGPLLFVNADKKELINIYNQLKKSQKNYSVYFKKEIPEHFHFSNNYLLGDILVLADMGWSILSDKDLPEMRKYFRRGNHGYDNYQLDMHGYFVASGPNFKKGYKTGTLKNIDIYPLLCEIYGIQPRSNIDGKIERIKFILKEK